MGTVPLNMNENMSVHSSHLVPPDTMNSMNSMRTSLGSNLMQSNNCDASTSIFNTNLYGGQSSGTTTTVQNPFDCDINTINSNIRTIRNPLSPFAPSYQAQNSYMSANAMSFSTMMNPMNPMNPIQSVHSTQTTQQQTINYNQTSFFLPIQTTNSINATYFNTNDQSHQNHFIGQ